MYIRGYKNQRLGPKTVLIVEPNPYHGEILPGYTDLFQKLGYSVHVMAREETIRDDPFAYYPEKKMPHIFAGTAQSMKASLKLGITGKYEMVFFSSSAFWENDYNHSSYISYLGFMPRGKYGSIFVEHNLSSLDRDDCRLFYSQGRVITLIGYSFEGAKTTYVNPHYFGEIPLSEGSSDHTNVLVLGSTSRQKDNLHYLYSILRNMDSGLRKKLRISIIGGEADIPGDLKDTVNSLGRTNFRDYYQAVNNSDFLLSLIDKKDPQQAKYSQGTTSGTVQTSLGFAKPMIIEKSYSDIYGFDAQTAVIYKEGGLYHALESATVMSGKHYEKLTKNLQLKSKKVSQESLENLSNIISSIKNNNPSEIELADQAALLMADQQKKIAGTIERLNSENMRLTRQLDNGINFLIDAEEQIESLNRKLQSMKGQLEAQKGGFGEILQKKFGNRVSRTPHSIYKKLQRRNRHKTLLAEKKQLKESNFFDEDYYLANNPDVKDNGLDPAEHYLRYGYKEGRQPGQLFDQAYYLAKNADVRALGLNPLLHYLNFGIRESREPLLHLDIDLEDKRLGLAFQVDAFDRGGLEEVVLMLASNREINEKYRAYIFVTGSEGGYFAELAQQKGIKVIFLNKDPVYLEYLIKKLNIKLCNLHYSIFGINKYKRNDAKIVYTIHNNYVWADEEFIGTRTKEYQKIDKFIAVSDQVKNYFCSKFGIASSKVDTIPNGIDTNSLKNYLPQSRQRFDIDEDDFVFIDVASFSPYKFQIDAVAALAKVVVKHPKAKLLLVGNVIDRNYFKNLKKAIIKYKVENSVKIIDYIPKEHLLGLYKISDCFLLPSLTEGFSIATLEAMYYELPLILTDVGGARHSIRDHDIGIIVKNVYGKPVDLTQKMVDDLYLDDSNLSNLDDLAAAMEDMIQHKTAWRKKAKLGREKVEKEYRSGNTIAGYMAEFQATAVAEDEVDVLKALDDALKNCEIAFFAPYPTPERITEGWMSRINAIDQKIGNRKKIYVNVLQNNDRAGLQQYEQEEWELTVGKDSAGYPAFLDKIISQVNLAYVHTLHHAEYVLPWLSSGKIVVDIHGITPEEEVMLGRAHLKEKYEYIEQKVLAEARACVMVTNAMAKHYKEKYPGIKPQKVIILPIVEKLELFHKDFRRKTSDQKFRAVYSGGAQTWQNIDAMMILAKECQAYTTVSFLSHEWKNLEDIGRSYSLPAETRYEFCDKKRLPKKYREYDFGLILRDETPVNRVASPTKLYEYMVCGLVPIVRSEHLGDFEEIGYGYIKENDYLKEHIPSETELTKILRRNYKAVDKLKNMHSSGAAELEALLTQNNGSK